MRLAGVVPDVVVAVPEQLDEEVERERLLLPRERRRVLPRMARYVRRPRQLSNERASSRSARSAGRSRSRSIRRGCEPSPSAAARSPGSFPSPERLRRAALASDHWQQGPTPSGAAASTAPGTGIPAVQLDAKELQVLLEVAQLAVDPTIAPDLLAVELSSLSRIVANASESENDPHAFAPRRPTPSPGSPHRSAAGSPPASGPFEVPHEWLVAMWPMLSSRGPGTSVRYSSATAGCGGPRRRRTRTCRCRADGGAVQERKVTGTTFASWRPIQSESPATPRMCS